MKKTIFAFAMIFILFKAPVVSVYPQENSSSNIKLIPSQERIPQPDQQPFIPPEYFIPPIGSPPSSAESPPVSKNSQPFKAPLVTGLERGKWYVQIGAYSRADHVDEAVNRAGTGVPVVIHSVGTSASPMFRVLLGPFSQNEGKTVQKRFKNKGYDAFLRKGN